MLFYLSGKCWFLLVYDVVVGRSFCGLVMKILGSGFSNVVVSVGLDWVDVCGSGK